MSWYRTGKASIYKGTREMTGYGTQWADNKHSINRGHIVLLPGSGTVQLYEIETVNSDSSITLTTDFTGETVSQGDYAIINTLTSTVPDFARRLAAQLQYNQELFDSIAEWVKSEEADVVIILPDGSEVKMPSLQQMKRDIEGASKLNKEVHKIEDDSTVIWKGNGLFKEVGVGYPRDGTTPSSRFGYHSKESTTPRLYMTDGSKQATLQFNLADGMVATREWVNKLAYNPNPAVTRLTSPNGKNVWQLEDSGIVAAKNTETDKYIFKISSGGLLDVFNSSITINGSNDYPGITFKKPDTSYVRFESKPESQNVMMAMSYVNKEGVSLRAFNIPQEAGTAATREFVNRYVTRSEGGGSQLRADETKVSVAVNPNNNAGIWDGESNRWMLRMNSGVGAADVTKNIFLVDQDKDSTSSKVEISSPDRVNRVGLWSYNDGRCLLSAYRNGGWSNVNVDGAGSGTLATREYVNSFTYKSDNISNIVRNPGGSPRLCLAIKDTGEVGFWDFANQRWAFHHNQANWTVMGTGTIKGTADYVGIKFEKSDKFSTTLETLPTSSSAIMNIIQRDAAGSNRAVHSVPTGNGTLLSVGANAYVDGSGYYKKSSPIIKIFKSGNFETNEESEGSFVVRESEGVYKVSGVLGFNSDGAWGGPDGGIEIPVDNNRQPLIWVDYFIEKDGSILLKTYHRVHKSSPSFAQNNIEGYSDGDPIDIPEGRFLSIRVEMPEDSLFNKKKEEKDILHERAVKEEERLESLKKIDSTINDVYNNGTEEQLKLPFFEEKEV